MNKIVKSINLVIRLKNHASRTLLWCYRRKLKGPQKIISAIFNSVTNEVWNNESHHVIFFVVIWDMAFSRFRSWSCTCLQIQQICSIQLDPHFYSPKMSCCTCFKNSIAFDPKWARPPRNSPGHCLKDTQGLVSSN